MTRSIAVAYLAAIALFLAACGGKGDNSTHSTPSTDAGMDAMTEDGGDATPEDVGDDDVRGDDVKPPDDMEPPEDMPPTDTLCSACTDDIQCGANNRCITLFDESICGRACDDANPCPEEYFCTVVDQMTMEQQCVPELLTCTDRCVDVSCEGGDVCDPLTGECNRPLRLCETDCLLSQTCGDGPEDQCFNMPGTPDGERACLTGCDPEAEMSECPPDFFCANTDEEDPNAGVCFPFQGTCVDRCAGVDCPAGENCSPVTGMCEAAQFGACEAGCTAHAQCDGQDDLCLDLGINDGAHCWQSCRDSECPSGYDCRGLLGTTLRICIPLGNDCSACDDNDCFPDGVCDPVADTCEELAASCTANDDCEAGSLCDPVSSTCVEIGRPCNGSTWAVDCDNAVTKCTTQISGSDGRCEQICTTDADCVTGTCVDTNLGRFCLGEDLGGATTCGALHVDGAENVGRPCSNGCFSPSSQCIDDGSIDGFCSQPCSGGCPTNERCGATVLGPSDDYCIPANCECAGLAFDSPALMSAVGTAWSTLGLSQCDVHFEPRRYEGIAELNDLTLGTLASDTGIEWRLRYPMTSIGRLADDVGALDASTDPVEHVRAVGLLADVDDSGVSTADTYPGAEGAVAEATAELITAAGGSPDLATLDVSAQAIPTTVQDAIAPIISSAARGVERRDLAASTVWGGTAQLPTLFSDAPYLLLPGSSAQEMAAQDLLDPNSAVTLSQAHEFSQLLMAGVRESFANVGPAIQAAAALAPTSFGTVVLDTPAGKVVIADHTDHTHDEATLGSEIAVLIDLGGNDTYRILAGANASVANAVSLLVDLDGTDDYGYDAVADPNDDPALLPSDADGRIAPTLPLNQANGPVSASDVARQGAGRVGYGMLFDVGTGTDTYSSLRMSQGASIFGVGVLFDDGPADFEAEALAQGAALGGLASLRAENAETNTYRVWHAGQGFGSAGGIGVAFDRGGANTWTAEPGGMGSVLYLSPVDRGVSNRNLAQGAGVGVVGEFQGGVGVVRSHGVDQYVAGTFAQGYGRAIGIGVLADAIGNDTVDGRGVVQGVGEWRAAGIYWDELGFDVYNGNTSLRLLGQGAGRTLGWGAFIDLSGDDDATYLPSGGGIGLDGGFGLAVNDGGDDTHTVSSDASWGFAQIAAAAGDPGFGERTVGIFVDAGTGTDTYSRPTLTGVGDGQVWNAMTTAPEASGVGVDD